MSDLIYKELCFDDVFILPQVNSLSCKDEIKLERIFHFVNIIGEDDSEDEDIKSKQIYKKWTGIPIIAKNNATFQTYNLLKNLNIITPLSKLYKLQDYIDAVNKGINFDPDYFMISTGIEENDFKNMKEIILYTNCKWINIDVENGYSDNFVSFCLKVRQLFPEKIIVAGNVITSEMVHTLITKAGVDIIKIGINNEVVINTGIGRPALTAIKDCADICRNFRELGFMVYTLSEFTINNPSDISKSFGAGADFVVIQNDDEKEIKYILDNLRNACQFIGAECIEDFPEKTVFVSN
jgi:GMP reductase